ncbi:hypothetical protein [Natronomonas sp.]|uniref:hypothetical protein n=1 Tax=Natronomonas sp. TaxID=2184060 RepID=UPI0026133FF3|nr:hypothetical protein [Natronomonas sp.]
MDDTYVETEVPAELGARIEAFCEAEGLAREEGVRRLVRRGLDENGTEGAAAGPAGVPEGGEGTERVGVRLSGERADRFDEFCAAAGASREAGLRRLLAAALETADSEWSLRSSIESVLVEAVLVVLVVLAFLGRAVGWW